MDGIKVLSAIEVALGLLKGVTALSANPLDDVIVGELQIAVAALEKVHGNPVFLKDLEEARLKKTW